MRQIAISDTEVKGYGMFPWRFETTCYNFKFPRETVHPDDIDKITDKSDIDALVINCDLSDYSFISDMTNLTHLYILSGENIADLSFIEKLVHLQQLCLAGTHFTSAEPLFKLTAEKLRLYNAALEKDNSPKNRIAASFDYALDAVCLESDRFDCEPDDLTRDHILGTNELIINGKRKKFRY